MAIKHKIKFKMYDQARGTSPAELRSSGPKQRPERVATTLGVEGERTGRSVPDNDNKYRSGGAYRAMLKLFSMHKNRTQIIFRFKCLIQKCREKGKWALAIRLRDRLYENYS